MKVRSEFDFDLILFRSDKNARSNFFNTRERKKERNTERKQERKKERKKERRYKQTKNQTN